MVWVMSGRVPSLTGYPDQNNHFVLQRMIYTNSAVWRDKLALVNLSLHRRCADQGEK